jgi:DNA-binding CsgD family transcriptional regulator
MLLALHELVPSDANTFLWTNESGYPVNMYAPEVAASTVDYMVNGYHLFQRPGELSIEALATAPLLTGNMARWHHGGRLERTLAYNEVFLPNRTVRVLDLIVRSGGKPRGVVLVNRGAGGRSFNAGEQRLLGELAPYFLHALEPAPAFPSSDTAATNDEAVFLCDDSGRVLARGPGAARMLLYATHAPIAPGAGGGAVLDMLPPVGRRLCHNLREIRAGRPAPAPIARVTNAWGTFVFQAHALNTGMSSEPEDRITVVIRREEPRALQLMSRLKSLPLSARQRQVALLIGLGRPPETVQAELDISPKTYRTYVERIHERLDVHSRAELIIALTG